MSSYRGLNRNLMRRTSRLRGVTRGASNVSRSNMLDKPDFSEFAPTPLPTPTPLPLGQLWNDNNVWGDDSTWNEAA